MAAGGPPHEDATAFVAGLLLGHALAAPCYADKRVALVIGNGAYKHTPALSNPPNDAADVAEALKAVGFDVTLKIDVDKRQMDQVVAQFARDGKGADALLFYYAGHGMQFEGKNYVMPVDAELQDEVSLRYELVGLDDVKSAMQLSRGVKIMVLDACRDNPLAEKFVRSISVSTRDVPKVQGYAPPEKAQGMIIVYATQADDVACDGTGRNSPFSAAFLKEIKEPGLEVGAMFRRIGGDVYAATDGRQSPELSISMVPEYYLNQSETDQTIWARIRMNATAATLREFLNRYPNSFYAPDARALLDLLDRQAREKADRQAAAEAVSSGDAEAARLREEQDAAAGEALPVPGAARPHHLQRPRHDFRAGRQRRGFRRRPGNSRARADQQGDDRLPDAYRLRAWRQRLRGHPVPDPAVRRHQSQGRRPRRSWAGPDSHGHQVRHRFRRRKEGQEGRWRGHAKHSRHQSPGVPEPGRQQGPAR
ncbi:caspase family protein, partial [Roseiarcus sp.]|uniref:caspase family protein n=1 Tax=Roseiarcus sp. TaxID=1969460 RepID=UPI003F9D8104